LLDLLLLDPAAEFLLRRTATEPTEKAREEAARVAADLQCLPLALEQAAAFMKHEQL
jgi:hypothetical protein